MYYIIILYGVGWVLQVFASGFYEAYLSLDPTMILRGQVWRLVTFLVYPPSTNVFYFLLGMYLYYSIGKTLEYQWGSFRFNLYFFTGVLLHILAAFICCYIFRANLGVMFGTYYLNMSLFFAYAATYPDATFLLFFIIPIKAKWLGIINGIYFGLTIIAGFFTKYLSMSMILGLAQAGILAHPAYSVMALVSLGNFLLFFFGMRNMRRYSPKAVYRRKRYAQSVQKGQRSVNTHKCAICGRTEKDGDHLEFRYCSKCNGNYEYCQDHLFSHEHIK
ncbi:MAG: rhomboid family intramembrane serine protease [Lachnospiraceae bacterium]|nr:rhomboid family intramembrane serine protease [Lachnospiraceae bacterium]